MEKEIEKINIKNQNEIPNIFLVINDYFISYLLRCLSRKDEVKTFLENILKRIFTRTAGFLNNQRDNMLLGFDLKKIVAFFKGKNYLIKRTNKNFKNFLDLFTIEIKKSQFIFSK